MGIIRDSFSSKRTTAKGTEIAGRLITCATPLFSFAVDVDPKTKLPILLSLTGGNDKSISKGLNAFSNDFLNAPFVSLNSLSIVLRREGSNFVRARYVQIGERKLIRIDYTRNHPIPNGFVKSDAWLLVDPANGWSLVEQHMDLGSFHTTVEYGEPVGPLATPRRVILNDGLLKRTAEFDRFVLGRSDPTFSHLRPPEYQMSTPRRNGGRFT